MFKKTKYICALDIGPSKISAALLEYNGAHIARSFFETSPSKGVREGVIVDAVELVNGITRLMKQLRQRSGVSFKYLRVAISGKDIVAKHSRAVIPLAERGNKVVTLSDLERVNEQARILGSSLEEEIIHIVPSGYSIDSKSNIANPIGLYSHRLETDLLLVCAKLSLVQSLNRIIHQAGYEMRDLFFSGLATSRAVFNKEASQGLNILCDIGSDTTELTFFKDGILFHIEILPFGGSTLTKELQESLKVPFELAEDIKRSHGAVVDASFIAEDKEILVKKTNLYKPIKKRAILELLAPKASYLCAQIKETVAKRVSFYEISNFFVVGRTLLLEGFIEAMETTLSLPVKIGRVAHGSAQAELLKDDDALSGQKYLTYLTCIGMCLELSSGKINSTTVSKEAPAVHLLARALNRLKEVYQEYF